jgi:hypothetical protein
MPRFFNQNEKRKDLKGFFLPFWGKKIELTTSKPRHFPRHHF